MTKTGAYVAHDLKLCPLVLQCLDLVPSDQRVGPVIIDETTGRPYAESAYGRERGLSSDPQASRTMCGTWTPGLEPSWKQKMQERI